MGSSEASIIFGSSKADSEIQGFQFRRSEGHYPKSLDALHGMRCSFDSLRIWVSSDQQHIGLRQPWSALLSRLLKS